MRLSLCLCCSLHSVASSAVQRTSSAGSGAGGSGGAGAVGSGGAGAGAGAVAGPACESAAEVAPEAPTGQPRRCIYFLGIIDTLSKYDAKSRAAQVRRCHSFSFSFHMLYSVCFAHHVMPRFRCSQAYKQVKHGAGAEISTARPDVYAKRLLEFVSRCSR